MTQNSSILQELIELESSLARTGLQNPYPIPEGYFEGLATTVLNRIRALEANDPAEELGHLSPFLAGLSRKHPYSVPVDYFNSLEDRLAPVTGNAVSTSVTEELESISPFLSSLKKEMPFAVPQGYFENLIVQPAEAKVISLVHRKWLRIAAAAVITGIIVLASFLYFNVNNSPTKSFAKFEKTIDKEIKKTSDQDLTEFVEDFTMAGLTETEKSTQVKADSPIFLKDVSDSELKQFLDETSDEDLEALSSPSMN